MFSSCRIFSTVPKYNPSPGYAVCFRSLDANYRCQIYSYYWVSYFKQCKEIPLKRNFPGNNKIGVSGTTTQLRICISKYCTKFKQSKLTKTIGFIGDGAMAKAICKSIERKGLIEYSQVYVSSPFQKNLDIWKEMGANVYTENYMVAKEADVIFLAVKPHMLKEAIGQISASPLAHEIKNKLFVSILAGITINDLEKMLNQFPESRVIRAMPNTPMMVGKGCTVYCPGTNITENDLVLVQKLLEVTGMCHLLPEHMINAVGAVSASGPAFVYLFIEALSDGGVRMGLHREIATKFAAQTVMGAAKMVLDTNKHMGTLKDDVCSAGGQTIAGIHALERGGVRGAVMDAVEAAAIKAAELGQQTKK